MYIPSFKLISQSMLKKSPENADGRSDGRTDAQNGVLWLLLSINLGAFFLCGYWVLCGCVCMSRPTKQCLVANFVHKFGCLFSCVVIGFVWLQINKTATSHKYQLYQKIATEVVFCKNEQSIHGHLDTNDHNLCVFFVSVHTWTLGHTQVSIMCVFVFFS